MVIWVVIWAAIWAGTSKPCYEDSGSLFPLSACRYLTNFTYDSVVMYLLSLEKTVLVLSTLTEYLIEYSAAFSVGTTDL